ncbi:MAG TPA: hypothetical protein VFF91_07390 [Pseudoxanthomonas sp.]|nr:hypothetical protein [Pseudoxanthomonas sp.]
MSARTTDACLLTLALWLAACTRPPLDTTGAETALAADARERAAARDDERAARDDAVAAEPPAADAVPPATAPQAAGALQAADFAGFAPVPFGADADALRAAWGAPLAGQAAEDGGCHYLFPQPRPARGYGTAFMVEGGRFVRMDVDDAGVTAPGGGRVGMQAEAIAALYPGQVEQRPHKYVQGGRYLRVTRPGSEAVLVFEADAQGRVHEWRIGVPPQVDYVEGCS